MNWRPSAVSGYIMRKPLLLAASVLTSSLFSAFFSVPAGAQTTYRCGNSYSQQPCPGGTVVDTADPRTSAQKTQAEQATQRDAKLASELEKSRLQKEKNRSGDGLPGAAPAIDKSAAQPQAKAPAKPNRPNQKQHEQQPSDFKAQAAGEPGKKKPAKTQRSEKASADSG